MYINLYYLDGWKQTFLLVSRQKYLFVSLYFFGLDNFKLMYYSFVVSLGLSARSMLSDFLRFISTFVSFLLSTNLLLTGISEHLLDQRHLYQLATIPCILNNSDAAAKDDLFYVKYNGPFKLISAC